MVLCTSVKEFFKWGSVVFEFYVPPFWSQSFRFARTDGREISSNTSMLDTLQNPSLPLSRSVKLKLKLKREASVQSKSHNNNNNNTVRGDN